MAAPLVRICVTGPECTGKTTLARRLADLLGTEWVVEAARVYAERVGRELLASDVGPIAREHIALAEMGAERALARGAHALMLDTDLASTIVYSRYYYGTVPRWVEREDRARRAHLYLLCDVDVPWMPDGVRDQPANREAMFERFRRALARRGANVALVRGEWEERWTIARRAAATWAAPRSPCAPAFPNPRRGRAAPRRTSGPPPST